MATDDETARAATEAVIERPPDHLVVTTGIGMRSWWNAAAAWSRDEALFGALRQSKILARGPKAIGAVTGLGLDLWFAAPTGEADEMVAKLLDEGIDGTHVAVQLPGRSSDELLGSLRAAGADVTAVSVYDWTWPDDLVPARRLMRAIADRRVAAVTFTSRPAVRNMLDLADRDGIVDEVVAALAGDVVAVCIGNVTASELRCATGIDASTPSRPILGMLVPALVERVTATAHHHLRVATGDDVIVQGRLVLGRGVLVTMSEREADVLRALVSDRRRAIARDALLRAVWPEGVDPSVLETTIARLRRRIARTGLRIDTINGRGYLLGGEPVPCHASRAMTTAGER